MSEAIVREAVAAFMARDLHRQPVPRHWLGARVRGAKIVFFGFFGTESDALEAVT